LIKAQKQAPIDVAIVPGLPLENGQWDTLLKTRIRWSEFLYKKGYVKNIVYSGSAVQTPWIEGSTMALYAKALGIDSQHVFVDTLAEHSTENLYFSYKLAREHGFKTIALATDPFQCAMLHRFAKKKMKVDLFFLPVISDSLLSHAGPVIIDTSLTRKRGFVALSERQDMKTRLKGTRGLTLKDSTKHKK
jgi:uncharacterized SAM-binding protein YcdF (DUF218 family)